MRRFFNRKKLIPTILILLAVFCLEAFVFNIRHFATRSGTASSYTAYDVSFEAGEVIIANINHRVRSLYLKPDFGETGLAVVDVKIVYADENNNSSQDIKLVNRYTPSFYVPLGAYGKVTELRIIAQNEAISLSDIRLNEPLPWNFQVLRVLLIVVLIWLVAFWRRRRLGDIDFSPTLRWQKIADVLVLALFVGLLFFTTVFSVSIGFSGGKISWHPSRAGVNNLYAHVTDAILLGQVHLDIEPDASLVNAAEPYNQYYREANNVVAPWDHAFYEGKFYCYYGITPVIVLFLPYHLLTQNYLSVTTATFIFSLFSAVGLCLLWRVLVSRYLPRIKYALYISGLAALLFGSNLMSLTVRGYIYEVAVAAGMMFSVYGLLFLLCAAKDDSYKTLNRRFLLPSGLCFALAVGSRPTMLYMSLLVPVVLFPVLRSCRIDGTKTWDKKALLTLSRRLLAFLIPYMLVALGLMWYNYARFGQISEFGARYNLTNENVMVVADGGWLGNLQKAFDGVRAFLLTNFNLQPRFPFVFATTPSGVFGGYVSKTRIIGLLMLPLTWFMSAALIMRKNERIKNVRPLFITMILISIVTAMTSATLAGFYFRYAVDFYWLVMIVSLLCAGIAHSELEARGEMTAARIVGSLHIAAAAITCFIMLAVGMVGENNMIEARNPLVMRIIKDVFTIL